MESSGVVVSAIVANLCATGCALLLIRWGPSRRLRLLILTVGLMSLSQTVASMRANSSWYIQAVKKGDTHQLLAAALSLLAIYLLGMEIRDHHFRNCKLRLLEQETMAPQQVLKDACRTAALGNLLEVGGDTKKLNGEAENAAAGAGEVTQGASTVMSG